MRVRARCLFGGYKGGKDKSQEYFASQEDAHLRSQLDCLDGWVFVDSVVRRIFDA